MADDTIRVIERLGIKPVHLAGFSMGGAIAQELAITRPDLVASLVLVGTWCRTDPFQYELFESWKREAAAAASDEQFARALVLWIYSRRAFADGSIKKWVSQMLAVPQPQSTDAFIRTIDAIQAHDTADRLGSILAPTLVIGGDSDRFALPTVRAISLRGFLAHNSSCSAAKPISPSRRRRRSLTGACSPF